MSEPAAQAETIVVAQPGEQCGYTILVGTCPRCGSTFAVNDAGSVNCVNPSCRKPLRFVDSSKTGGAGQ